MITMDCILEIFSAVLLITANVYCSSDGTGTNPALSNINFSKFDLYNYENLNSF